MSRDLREVEGEACGYLGEVGSGLKGSLAPFDE